MNKKLLLFPLIVFQLGFIKSQTVKMDDVPFSEKWFALGKQDLGKKIKLVKDPLARAAAAETLGQLDTCVSAAKQVNIKNIVFDRALMLELRCAKRIAEDEKVSAAPLLDALARIKKNEKHLTAADKNQVLTAQLTAAAALVKKSQWKLLASEINKLAEIERELSKAQRALLYSYTAELMVSDRKWSEAYSYLTRAKDLDPELPIDVRIKNVISLMPASVKEKIEKIRPKPAGPEIPVAAAPPEEQELFDQAQTAYSKGDITVATEAMIKLLIKYPVSVKSKWCQEKLTELTMREIERSRGADGNSVAKSKIIKQLLDLDPDRLYDWGRTLFDMQAYGDAAKLFEKSAEETEGSVKAAKALYFAGRSYQLSQEYGKAKDFYKQVTKSFSMTPEFIDASIQWGLINLNEKDVSEAITHFEMARSRKMTYQQDMVSLFWLFQAYKIKGETALKNKTALDLVERFPLTYYGLIAYFELNQKLPSYDKTDIKDVKISLSAAEWKALNRARVLLRAGLIDDATDELSIFNQRSLSSEEGIYLSKFFAQSLNYQKVFNILGGLFDENIEYRSDSVVRDIFPKEYWAQVNDDKKRANLDPLLLLSVMRQESAFKTTAVSRSGAVGLMQMIPPTAEEVKKELGDSVEVPKDLTDPNVNIRFCAYYLAKLIKKFDGSIPLALAAYNAGPTRISQFIKAQGGSLKDTWVDELPLTETTFYVKSILKNYLVYKIVYAGQTQLGTPPWSTP